MNAFSRTAIGVAFGTVSVAILVIGTGPNVAAQSDKIHTAPHGAASMETQRRELKRLLKNQNVQNPEMVDEAIWKEMIPKDNELNHRRIELGQKLFFDTALSKDGTVACATCHDTTRSFTDRRKVSEGVDDQLGQRNAPTIMNAALLHTQFLDGREPTLERQAGQPILNPVEMAMPNKETAVAAISKIPAYKPLFKAAYGRDINYDDIERALAAFERTLIFLDAPFDRFLGGDQSAISEDAKKGWTLFNGTARCVSCHPISISNPLGTDNRMHNIGVSAHKQDFEKLARKAIDALAKDSSQRKLDELAVGTDMSELGRFMVTRNYADIGSFRTPQLRNIGITNPYMHDGSMETLFDVVDHYNKGGEINPFLDGSMEGLNLSEEEIHQLVAFLFTLTDYRFVDLNNAELKKQSKTAQSNRPFRDTRRSNREVLPFEERVFNSAKSTVRSTSAKSTGGSK